MAARPWRPAGRAPASGPARTSGPANVGTETSGSILSPSNQNMLAAVKPTVGRVSRYGVIPITADQDTPGPMAKFVVDAAIMLGVLEGAAPDAADPATATCERPTDRGLHAIPETGWPARHAHRHSARFLLRSRVRAGNRPAARRPEPRADGVMADAIGVLKQQGAIVVDPADIPSVTAKDPQENFLVWGACSGVGRRQGEGRGLLRRASSTA